MSGDRCCGDFYTWVIHNKHEKLAIVFALREERLTAGGAWVEVDTWPDRLDPGASEALLCPRRDDCKGRRRYRILNPSYENEASWHTPSPLPKREASTKCTTFEYGALPRVQAAAITELANLISRRVPPYAVPANVFDGILGAPVCPSGTVDFYREGATGELVLSRTGETCTIGMSAPRPIPVGNGGASFRDFWVSVPAVVQGKISRLAKQSSLQFQSEMATMTITMDVGGGDYLEDYVSAVRVDSAAKTLTIEASMLCISIENVPID